ncbi:hypothetical protein [Paractinoplanes toevensis]|uniref:Uncharacterized protein n=1 Tax=Paractinoplanes toevensis TaxID=571911 RepID=A0A919T6T8_9ACTN|nr:hypothetical protein [Actinoplanes toevensis]GIM89101.1 hypothetical protein Ato02nite_008940 [Actinoplanes toevensis]
MVKSLSYGATTLGALLGGIAAAWSCPRLVIAAAALLSATATFFLPGFPVDNRRGVGELGLTDRPTAETVLDHYESWRSNRAARKGGK